MKFRITLAGAIAFALGTLGPISASAVSLQDAVKATIESNPDVRQAANRRLAIDQEIEQAVGGYLPDIDVDAGIGWEQSHNATTHAQGDHDVQKTRRELGIRLRQMLFDGFLTTGEVERHMARAESAAYLVQSAAEESAQRAVEAYLNVLRRQQLVKLAEDNLAAHQKVHDQIKLRADRGVGRKADLSQIQGRLALAESNLISEQNNLRDAETTYLRVVGVLPEDLQSAENVADKLPPSVDEATQMAVDNHPTLKSADADIVAREKQHDVAKSPFYPRFDLEYSSRADKDLDGQPGINNEDQVMLRVRYNLFNGGSDVARRAETAHLINEAKDIRDRTQRQVVESLRLSWTSYQAADSVLAYRRQHVESALQTKDAYGKQFNIGQRTLLDLLDTENELFEAQRAYTNADYDRLNAEYRILAGMGALTKDLDVPLPQEASVPRKD